MGNIRMPARRAVSALDVSKKASVFRYVSDKIKWKFRNQDDLRGNVRHMYDIKKDSKKT